MERGFVPVLVRGLVPVVVPATAALIIVGFSGNRLEGCCKWPVWSG